MMIKMNSTLLHLYISLGELISLIDWTRFTENPNFGFIFPTTSKISETLGILVFSPLSRTIAHKIDMKLHLLSNKFHGIITWWVEIAE